MLCLIKAAVGWVILMLIGTNLTGLVVRGVVPPPAAREAKNRIANPLVQELMARYRRANVGVTIFFAALGLAYLYALLRLWNIGVVAAAVMLILARLPDLLWKIHTGHKVTTQLAPKGPGGILATLLSWGALPVLWLALCRG